MSKHKIADWARLLDLQDILAERDRMIAGLTVEYRDTQKQLAASQEREAVIREQLEWYGDIRNYDDVDGALLCPVLVDCGLKARAALVADADQAAERVQAVVEAAREWKRHTDTFYGPPREWWDSVPRRLYEAVAALATPGKGGEE